MRGPLLDFLVGPSTDGWVAKLPLGLGHLAALDWEFGPTFVPEASTFSGFGLIWLIIIIT